MKHATPILVLLTSTAATASALCAQGRTDTSVELAGGKVTVDYTSTKLRGRSPADIGVGTAWRMSKDMPARLTTTLPLATRKGIVPPGVYNLAAKRVRDDHWELLLYTAPGLFRDGVEHHDASQRLFHGVSHVLAVEANSRFSPRPWAPRVFALAEAVELPISAWPRRAVAVVRGPLPRATPWRGTSRVVVAASVPPAV